MPIINDNQRPVIRNADAPASVGPTPGVTADAKRKDHAVDTTTRVSPARLDPARHAVAELRTLIQSGGYKDLCDAFAGRYFLLHRDSGAPAAKLKEKQVQLKARAEELFAALPCITADTPPAELVSLKLISQAPKNIDVMLSSPRYLVGRQVMVATTIDTTSRSPERFGEYDPNGHRGLTHKASIAGESGDDFLVRVDGADEPISVPKEKIVELNQPQHYPGTRFTLNGLVVDYNHPATKAKICEALIGMDSILGSIDFAQGAEPANQGVSGFYTRKAESSLQAKQERCVDIVHDVIRMGYSHEPYYGNQAGEMAMGSSGECYCQAGVMAGLLYPFTKLLGIDIRFVNGRVFRNASGDPPFNGGPHGWVQVTYRPNMVTKITDRTWCQRNLAMDRAYSFTGDRWPFGVIPPNGLPQLEPLQSTDIDCSGKVRLDMGKRQSGIKGVDDRSKHQD